MRDVRFADEVTYISDAAKPLGRARPYHKTLLFLKGLGLATLLYLGWSYSIAPSRGGRLPIKQSNEKLLDFDDVRPPSTFLKT
jgi:hypothetical protein